MKLRSNQAFTLLEVLTATTILLIVCAFVLKISTQVLDTWGYTSKKINTEREVQTVLEILKQDLETALPYFWIYNENANGAEKIKQLCLFSYTDGDKPYAIAYEANYDPVGRAYAIYRHALKMDNSPKYSVKFEDPLSLLRMSSKQTAVPSNLLAKNIRNFSVKFLYRDANGNSHWTSMAPFPGTAICADIEIITVNETSVKKRITFVGVSRL